MGDAVIFARSLLHRPALIQDQAQFLAVLLTLIWHRVGLICQSRHFHGPPGVNQ